MALTALFGGSFDPVHTGHIKAADAVLNAFPELSRLIIMPAWVSPFKTENAPRASASERLEMCRIAFRDRKKCIVSDYEINRESISYTADTVAYLKKTYPEDRLILTVGSDSLSTLPEWHRAEEIIKNANIAAVSRYSEEKGRIDAAARVIRSMGGNVDVLCAPPFEISSGEIREMLVSGKDASAYLADGVYRYIRDKGIYL